MSPKVEKINERFKSLDKTQKKNVYSFKKFATNGVKSIDSVINKATKLTATFAATAGALAIKTGLSEAMDLEGYKLQLETATKDTKKASEVMKYAIDLANKTPFEGGQLVEGAAKFEAMGMSAKKWLTLTGDMAAATNKDFDQATEALIDAQNGELERLKEFGIKKQNIVDKANQMFKNQEVVNAKGQIVNQEKFNEALIAVMEERYTGGMEKQSKSLKGIMSTISGVMKSGLASIMGMKSDGTVAKGSLFDTLRQKAEQLAVKFQQWQSDGTFDRIGQKVNQWVSLAAQKIGAFMSSLNQHKGTILTVAKYILAFAAAFKAIMFIVKIVKVLKTIWNVLMGIKTVIMIVAGVSSAAAAGIMAGVALVVAGVVLLIKHWDKVKAAAIALWDKIKEVATGIKEAFGDAWGAAKEKAKAAIDSVMGFIQPLIDKVNAVKDAVSNGWNSVKEKASGVWNKVTGGTTKGHATGTTYASGGLRMINERGSGEIVDLPNGSRVIPADQSRRMSQGTNIEVNVTIQGNVIGNKAFADEIGNTVCQKLVLVLDNM